MDSSVTKKKRSSRMSIFKTSKTRRAWQFCHIFAKHKIILSWPKARLFKGSFFWGVGGGGSRLDIPFIFQELIQCQYRFVQFLYSLFKVTDLISFFVTRLFQKCQKLREIANIEEEKTFISSELLDKFQWSFWEKLTHDHV